jgi:hypothetical protein
LILNYAKCELLVTLEWLTVLQKIDFQISNDLLPAPDDRFRRQNYAFCELLPGRAPLRFIRTRSNIPVIRRIRGQGNPEKGRPPQAVDEESERVIHYLHPKVIEVIKKDAQLQATIPT